METNFKSAGPAHDCDEEIHDVYTKYRYQYYGILDSIRFTARDLDMKAIDIARTLELQTYFMEHR